MVYITFLQYSVLDASVLFLIHCYIKNVTNETSVCLTQTCHCEGNNEKFQLTVNMAKKMLPHQTTEIDVIVAEYSSISEVEGGNNVDIVQSASEKKPNEPTQFHQN